MGRTVKKKYCTQIRTVSGEVVTGASFEATKDECRSEEMFFKHELQTEVGFISLKMPKSQRNVIFNKRAIESIQIQEVPKVD